MDGWIASPSGSGGRSGFEVVDVPEEQNRGIPINLMRRVHSWLVGSRPSPLPWRVVSTFVFALFVAEAPGQLDENGTVPFLNRSAQVNSDGWWGGPKVPREVVCFRVRAKRVHEGVTRVARSGYTSIFDVPCRRQAVQALAEESPDGGLIPFQDRFGISEYISTHRQQLGITKDGRSTER